MFPSLQPRTGPTSVPTLQLTMIPASIPSSVPSCFPSHFPSSQQTNEPTVSSKHDSDLKAVFVQSSYATAASINNNAQQWSNMSPSLTSTLFANAKPNEGIHISIASAMTMTVAKAIIGNTSILTGNQSYALSPPIYVGNSTSSISIAMDGLGSGGSVLMSILSFGRVLFAADTSNKTLANSSYLPAPKLVSDVLSIQISVSDGASYETRIMPSFVANIAVNDIGDVFVAPVLHHNCSVDIRMTRVLLCPELLVLINVKCSGLAAATVRRKCPVPERVCNVSNLNDMCVASDNCHAVQSSGSSVKCEGGLDKSVAGGNTSSALSEVLTSSGGAVNVAVMTKFVAGDFGGTKVAGSMSLSGNVAQQSALLVVAFG